MDTDSKTQRGFGGADPQEQSNLKQSVAISLCSQLNLEPREETGLWVDAMRLFLVCFN